MAERLRRSLSSSFTYWLRPSLGLPVPLPLSRVLWESIRTDRIHNFVTVRQAFVPRIRFSRQRDEGIEESYSLTFVSKGSDQHQLQFAPTASHESRLPIRSAANESHDGEAYGRAKQRIPRGQAPELLRRHHPTATRLDTPLIDTNTCPPRFRLRGKERTRSNACNGSGLA